MINKSTIKAYACINKNTSIRQKSSSGGCYFALAKDFIEQGGIVYSASSNNGAVQNIVNELPLTKEQIDEKFVEELKGADYFCSIALK